MEYLKVELRLNILLSPSGETVSEEAKKEMILTLWCNQAKLSGTTR
ncbi:MAG: hypothetical protein QXJ75_03445 [Candidatus Bathyarchaeia archaeon]